MYKKYLHNKYDSNYDSNIINKTKNEIQEEREKKFLHRKIQNLQFLLFNNTSKRPLFP